MCVCVLVGAVSFNSIHNQGGHKVLPVMKQNKRMNTHTKKREADTKK
jgi:hypothetical protein